MFGFILIAMIAGGFIVADVSGNKEVVNQKIEKVLKVK